MTQRPVILQLRHSARIAKSAEASRLAMAAGEEFQMPGAAVPKLAALAIDTSFPTVQLPGRTPRKPDDETRDFATFDLDADPAVSTYLVRGLVDEKKIDALLAECAQHEDIEGVYADVEIAPFVTCPSGPIGNDHDVEQLLCVSKLNAADMDGNGVLVAIVDSGVDLAWLDSKGKTPSFDASKSWKPPGASGTPGSYPPGHGTMCAFDVCIAAPKCTILDIALLRSVTPGGSLMEGLLSDAVLAYSHLLGIMKPLRGDPPSLVVNNSWGMYRPSWDFPVGHPGNYSDNPNHPFNLIVSTLERAGADILFAAGNCGPECPSSKCQGHVTKPIYGANGHPKVLSVAGASVQKDRVGYSSMGPGRLAVKKPDITGYTHFKGSGIYSADNGTSAACPVVAGVVAAARSVRPYVPSDANTHPSALRALVRTTAEDISSAGFDFGTGYGLINACAIKEKLKPSVTVPTLPTTGIPTRIPTSICDIYPELCDPWWKYRWLCRRYPWLCGGTEPGVPFPPRPPVSGPPLPGPDPRASFAGPAAVEGAEPTFTVDEVAAFVSWMKGAPAAQGTKSCSCRG